ASGGGPILVPFLVTGPSSPLRTSGLSGAPRERASHIFTLLPRRARKELNDFTPVLISPRGKAASRFSGDLVDGARRGGRGGARVQRRGERLDSGDQPGAGPDDDPVGVDGPDWQAGQRTGRGAGLSGCAVQVVAAGRHHDQIGHGG